MKKPPNHVLVVDEGGNHVKLLLTGQENPREFDSGPSMTPEEMVAGIRKAAKDWKYDVVSIGYPGAVLRGKPVSEPHNLGPGWVGFDFEAAFGCPVKIIKTPPCKLWGTMREGRCFSWDWAPASVPPWSWTASSSRWN